MRNWERPMVVVDTFAANEFVSSCGVQNTVYLFKCNAGEKRHKYNVYYYDKYNQRHYIASNDDWDGAQFDGYHPCDATHEASTKDEFINGYIDDQRTRKDERVPVVIWTDRGTDVHCTTDLQKNTWQTAKS